MALAEYRAAYHEVERDLQHCVLFNTRTGDCTAAIGRKQAWAVISGVCGAVGLRGNYGTHTLRKSWGCHARMNGMDPALSAYAQPQRPDIYQVLPGHHG